MGLIQQFRKVRTSSLVYQTDQTTLTKSRRNLIRFASGNTERKEEKKKKEESGSILIFVEGKAEETSGNEDASNQTKQGPLLGCRRFR